MPPATCARCSIAFDTGPMPEGVYTCQMPRCDSCVSRVSPKHLRVLRALTQCDKTHITSSARHCLRAGGQAGLSSSVPWCLRRAPLAPFTRSPLWLLAVGHCCHFSFLSLRQNFTGTADVPASHVTCDSRVSFCPHSSPVPPQHGRCPVIPLQALSRMKHFARIAGHFCILT